VFAMEGSFAQWDAAFDREGHMAGRPAQGPRAVGGAIAPPAPPGWLAAPPPRGLRSRIVPGRSRLGHREER